MKRAAYIIYMTVLVLSPVFFGAVEYYAYTFLILGVLLASVLLIASDALKKRAGGRTFRWPKTRFNAVWLAITVLLVLQLIPLPEAVIRFVSPTAWLAAEKSVPTSALAGQAGVPDFFAFAVYRHPVQLALCKFTAYALFFFGMLRLLDSRRRVEQTVMVILVVCIAEIFYGLCASFGEGRQVLWYKLKWDPGFFTGSYMNHNHFAGLLEIGLMLAAGYAAALTRSRKGGGFARVGIRQRFVEIARDSEKRSRWLFVAFSGVVIIVGLALSASRGGIISSAVGLLTLSVLFLFRTDHRWKGKVLLAIFAVGMIYALQAGVGFTVKRFENTPEDMKTRIRLASTTLDIFKDYPAAGIGIGNFPHVYPRYQSAFDGRVFWKHAHSDWAQFLAEAGIAGFLATMAGAVWFLAGFLQRWRQRRDPLAVCLGAALPAVVAAYATHALAEFNFHIPANFLMFTAAAAVCSSALLLERRGHKTVYGLSYRRMRVKGVGILPLLLVMVLVAWCTSKITSHFSAEAGLAAARSEQGAVGEKAEQKATKTTLNRKLAAARSAWRRDPDNAGYPYLAAEIRMQLRQEATGSEGIDAAAASGRSPADLAIIRLLEESIRLNPYPAIAHLQLGWEYTRRFDQPDYDLSWLPAADISMKRAAYFTGEKTPRHHVELGHYWTMRSTTKGPVAWVLAVWHYKKALVLEPKARVRRQAAEEIRRFVEAFYPGQVDARMAEILP